MRLTGKRYSVIISMEKFERRKEVSLLRNQPYDESLEVGDTEEVASVYSPSPRSHSQVQSSEPRRLLKSKLKAIRGCCCRYSSRTDN